MSVNGFLLGAGASFELSMPLVDELTITFKRSLLKNIDAPYYDCPLKIKEFAKALLQDNDLNYEEIIGRIEVELQRCRDINLRNHWHWLLERYNEAIFVFLLEQHQRNISYIEERLKFLEPIKNFCTDSPLWIFSLNHDLLIEIIASYLSLPIKYGLHEKESIAGLTFEKLTHDNMSKNHFSFFVKEPGINLIKIHGAIDLFVRGNEKEYYKLANANSWQNFVSDLDTLFRNDAATKDWKGRVTNEITYHDENNIVQFLRMSIMSGKHKYSTRINHTLGDWFLKIFHGHINHVKNLFCIGYSFGDQHINDTLNTWLTANPENSITIVDPFITEVPNAFKHLKDQFKIVKMGFLQFLNQDADPKTLRTIKLFENARQLSRRIYIQKNSLP